MKGLLFVLSGPSGVGKTTVRLELTKYLPEVFLSVSATTRKRREGERDEFDYYFTNKEEFNQQIEQNKMLEWAYVHGNFYGTPIAPIDKAICEGKNCLLVIDVQGAKQVREKISSSILIFLLPPSFPMLEQRLKIRGTEDEQMLRIRLENAKQELVSLQGYNYSVINHTVSQAVRDVVEVITRCINRRKHDR